MLKILYVEDEIKADKNFLHQKKDRVIILPTDEGSACIKLSDILYAEKLNSRLTRTVTRKRVFQKSYYPLRKLLDLLNDEMFTLSNKSCIVNVSNIEIVKPVSAKTWDIFFKDAAGIKCALSYRYHGAVIKLLSEGGHENES